MKFLVQEKDLTKLDWNFKCFLEKYKEYKFIDKIASYYRKYRKICWKYSNNKEFTILVKSNFSSRTTFYKWAKIFFYWFYQNKNNDFLLFKSRKPLKINYYYKFEDSQKLINYFIQYKNNYGIGVFHFHYILKIIDDTRFNNLPKPNIKTIYKWLKRFNLNFPKRKVKKNHPRYEVKEVGLLQTDVKVISKYITGDIQNWYILDYIDEKSRIVYSYPSKEATIYDLKIATVKALRFYKNLGINVSRIRTDNGIIYTNISGKKNMRNLRFTNFCKENGIVHETTPFRSPQSNGKIERFHRNWSNLFEVKSFLNNDFAFFQELVTSFQNYYNNSKPYKSLNLITPITYLKKFLLK